MNKTLLVLNEGYRERGVKSAGYCSFDGDGTKDYTSRATEDYRLIYVKRGRIKFIKNGKVTVTAGQGKLLLLTPGAREKTVCTSDCLDFWVSFGGFSKELGELGISSVGISVKKCHSDGEYVSSQIESIITELQIKERGYNLAAESKLMKLLIYFCRSKSTVSASLDGAKKKISPALLIMNNEFDKTYSMDYYAKKCNMSKSSFLHIFSKVMHTTPIKYLNEIKIKNAAVMLTETDMSISEIAAALGFSSPQYFSNTFLHYNRIRPTAYRRKKGKGV